MTHRVTIITRVTTEDGIIGEIYNGDELDDLDKIVNMLKTEITPLVLGGNIFEVNRIWEKIYPLTFNILANRKIAVNAISCIDSAIHDAIGKSLGVPLVKLWGGTKTELPVMLIGGYYTEGVEVDEKAIVSDIENYKQMGVAAYKFTVGGRTPEVDVKRVELS
jgi:L-alanine-DL-glutamate epimerase-like enolase superfamily enzyme